MRDEASKGGTWCFDGMDDDDGGGEVGSFAMPVYRCRLGLVQWQGELCLLFPFLRPRSLLYRAYGNHEISLDPSRSLWQVHP